MGISALAAMLALLLAFLAQSPRFMRRLGLDVYRLDLRVRAFTGYALAALLLLLGFFLAGVPLGPPVPPEQMVAEVTATLTLPAGTADVPATLTRSAITGTVSIATPSVTPRVGEDTPASGAFGGLPPRPATATVQWTPAAGTTGDAATPPVAALTPTGEVEVTATGTPTRVTTPTPSVTPTSTPTPTPSPTPTSTPSPTATPTPTLTPTPIDAETAIVDGNGGSIWLYRSPGGQRLVMIEDDATVILLPRHASQGGILWRQVMTVQGFTGWVDERYLVYGS